MISNKNLKDLNSLKLEYSCKNYFELNNHQDLFELSKEIRKSSTRFWILGEGTNVVILKNLDGLVIKNNLLGISYQDNFVNCASGENWDNLVKRCLEQKLYGFENLSGIPGSVGAGPIQNIGAYGVEISSFIEYVEVFNLITGNFEVFDVNDCKFAYRNSIFKELPNHLITNIRFSLSTNFQPNLSYESIPQDSEISSAEELRNLILSIRNDRLVNPNQDPNVGSFFKNPIVSKSKLKELKNSFPEIKFYDVEHDLYKISAAWLIENIGMKGKQDKSCGVSKKHSLVLVNFSDKSESIINLSNKIKSMVKSRFDLELETEPTFVH